MKTILRIAIAFMMFAPARLFAWGETGHKTVCAIAWHRLTPAAHEMISRVLGSDDEEDFVDACIWADHIRRQMPETYNYHFINIPAGVQGMDMQRDCGDVAKRCAPWAIAHYASQLIDGEQDPVRRREALMFVMHFVGDLHQPLHAGRPGDLGGNRVLVEFFGNAGNAEHHNNLHSVWDSQILSRAGAEWDKTSRMLLAQIDTAEAHEWESLDVVAWANDSYRVCEEYVYGKLPADHRIQNDYYMPAAGYVGDQLLKGGVRLAYLLNNAAEGRVPSLPGASGA